MIRYASLRSGIKNRVPFPTPNRNPLTKLYETHYIYTPVGVLPLATLQADNLTPIVSVVPCPVQMVPGTGELPFLQEHRVEGGKRGTGPRGTEFRQPLHPGAGFTPMLKTGRGKVMYALSPTPC